MCALGRGKREIMGYFILNMCSLGREKRGYFILNRCTLGREIREIRGYFILNMCTLGSMKTLVRKLKCFNLLMSNLNHTNS